MKTVYLQSCAVLASIGASVAPCAAQSGDAGRNAQIDTFPQVRASPGLYQSGNECAPDRAEAAWGPNNKFLGYVCVRNPSHR